MLTVNKLIPQGRGLAAALLKRAGSVELDWDVRQKSRFEATDAAGRPLGVFLPRGTVVRGGDVLVAEDGSLVRVLAALQPVMEVRPGDESGTPRDLPRAAYHLGNRHVAVEVQADHLKIEPDHVLAQMLRQLGLIVAETQAAFEPEGGAYGAEAAGHGHAHDHDHGPAAASTAARGKPVPVAVGAAPAPHVHGPGCGHDHGHGHKHKP
jgi:urease accessory protein